MTMPRKKLPPPETLVAATFFLMTRHATIRCPLVGRVIARQLQLLAKHPSETLAPHLRAVCAKLSVQWAREAQREAHRHASVSGDEAAGPHSIH